MGTPGVSSHQALHNRDATALRQPPHLPQRLVQPLQPLLQQADIRLNGERPWDMQIHHPRTLQRIVAAGSLGLGEAWHCGRREGGDPEDDPLHAIPPDGLYPVLRQEIV